ncbi:MAG: hypothetical protein HY557_05480 [Euryarchaeota archaeon]|nr:hypothetical protein [Euryarchaeota archaeon]
MALLFLGLGWTWGAFNATQESTFTLPAGEGWHAVLELNVADGARLSGKFTVTSGIVDLFLFTEDQYAAFWNGDPFRILLAVTSERSSFSLALPEPGKHFLLIDHGAGFEWVTQQVRLEWQTVDLHPPLLAVGFAAVVVGVELVIGGFKVKGKAKRLRFAGALAPRSP